MCQGIDKYYFMNIWVNIFRNIKDRDSFAMR